MTLNGRTLKTSKPTIRLARTEVGYNPRTLCPDASFVTFSEELKYLESCPLDGQDKLQEMLGEVYEGFQPRQRTFKQLCTSMAYITAQSGAIIAVLDRPTQSMLVLPADQVDEWVPPDDVSTDRMRSLRARTMLKNDLYRMLAYHKKDAWKVTVYDVDGSLLGIHEPFYGDLLDKNGIYEKLIDYHRMTGANGKDMIFFRPKAIGITPADSLNIIWDDPQISEVVPLTRKRKPKNSPGGAG